MTKKTSDNLYRENYKKIYDNWLASGKLTKHQESIAKRQIAKRCYFKLSTVTWKDKNIAEST